MTTGEDASLPPLLELMGEKPKQVIQPPIVEKKNNNKPAPYPELNFSKKTPETKEDRRPIAKLFKQNKDNKPITQAIDFGNPDKWGDVHQTPAICDEIKGIVELNETIETNGNYAGPILVELKNGKKFFSGGFSGEQTCYELGTNLGLLEIKAQYWR